MPRLYSSIAELSWLEHMGTVQRRVNAGQTPHFSQKNFNMKDFELSNKLSKAKRSFLSNNENVVIKSGF